MAEHETLKQQVEAMGEQIKELRADVKTLLANDSKRQGREKALDAANLRMVTEAHERNNWLRALMPWGAIAGIGSALAWIASFVTGD